ncbi:hypothetical protein QH639_18295 [Lysinibacillus sp. 1 U-2021]|uniref:hypothetical protein n=1 Tax=Lysinibacillus sp. 1 U-2021 TaxID=3039426 RepID=UPI00247FF82B|nr:hypothetical protein [Lysinibacillus sp. 1 U-2021]WGT37771.1 hypothetical protein QH639_18295 [Lysinibacillus sp. 1 U-2021]
MDNVYLSYTDDEDLLNYLKTMKDSASDIYDEMVELIYYSKGAGYSCSHQDRDCTIEARYVTLKNQIDLMKKSFDDLFLSIKD